MVGRCGTAAGRAGPGGPQSLDPSPRPSPKVTRWATPAPNSRGIEPLHRAVHLHPARVVRARDHRGAPDPTADPYHQGFASMEARTAGQQQQSMKATREWSPSHE